MARTDPQLPASGRQRVVLEHPAPDVDAGRFPVKRIVGDVLRAEIDAFADGHDVVAGLVRYQRVGEDRWHEATLAALGNDRWFGDVPFTQAGRHHFTFAAWIDRWATWRRDLDKRVAAAQNVTVDLHIGAQLVRDAIERVTDPDDGELLATRAAVLDFGGEEGVAAALDPELDALMHAHPDRAHETAWPRPIEVVVDRERARFGAWYERFPRSTAAEPGVHGTFDTLRAELPLIAELGFDVLYLPPIHPIGAHHRKGPNNVETAGPHDPGSPWAIGSVDGGHTSVHPELGTLEDFDRLVVAAGEVGLEIALDLAYQCAPDHPWVSEHPSWFRHRPDGSIQYAENPPKKYQDIYPIDFETDDWRELWVGLRGVVDFWIARGVRIFRVDNPHTKAFGFWEWMIGAVTAECPDVIFLAEAFTRPKVMARLAKLGFTQSYTYFTWRQEKWELEQYLTELTQGEAADYLRPNFWPNTPDILTEQLQAGSRGTYVQRLVLAATLAASYGIYGPAFELLESAPAKPGSEEYLDSEKYEVRWRDPRPVNSAAAQVTETIRLVNAARRAHPALQENTNLRFH
ncbi:MAG: alpha-1,4-glucan--maltose-1-phosphate maltosyltransferase, partial [Thermoleophilia bacterium]|nr:alpha-1,4-glucan--maltose-1-phosphate maltosyltransferase [Thermoleophilia bacterium]